MNFLNEQFWNESFTTCVFLRNSYESKSLHLNLLLNLTEKSTWKRELFTCEEQTANTLLWCLFHVKPKNNNWEFLFYVVTVCCFMWNIIFMVMCHVQIESFDFLLNNFWWQLYPAFWSLSVDELNKVKSSDSELSNIQEVYDLSWIQN